MNKAGIHKAVSGLESISAETWREESEISGEVREMQRELGSERADVLSRTTSEKAQKGSTQSSGCAEGWGLLFFFKSEDSLASLPLAWTAWTLALEVDDEDFRQSFVEWLGLPQNMHKLFSKWRYLSCRVNFLSLPSLLVMDAEFLEED